METLESGESVETLESEEWWSQVWCSVVIASGGGGLDAFRGRKFSSRALVHGEGHVALIGFYACMCGYVWTHCRGSIQHHATVNINV